MRQDTIESFRSKGKSVCDYVQNALSLANTIGGRQGLNCIAEIDPTAMAQAEALDADGDRELPLVGVPVLVKDNIDVQGLHTTAGSLALGDNLAAKDAPIIRNLRRNGAVILGKTNMTEFANYTADGMPAGYSSRGGQVIHAIDPSASPSGSSSGSGVAVCAGIVPVAVGTDTSFSVVGCAQANGICGLKPPVGALSSEGIIPIARTLDSAGAMANTFSDALKLYSAMRDTPMPEITPAEISKLKIAVNRANRDTVSEGQMAFLQNVLDTLRDAGAEIAEIGQPSSPDLKTIMQWEFRPHLEEYLRKSGAARKSLREIVAYYEANPEQMLRYGDSRLRAALEDTPGELSGKPYLDAMANRRAAIARVTEELCGFDAVILTGSSSIMHLCGLPSAAVAGKNRNDSGIPRGLILYGSDELRLYRVALAIEQMI